LQPQPVGKIVSSWSAVLFDYKNQWRSPPNLFRCVKTGKTIAKLRKEYSNQTATPGNP
jgi:hypothetical protein